MEMLDNRTAKTSGGKVRIKESLLVNMETIQFTLGAQHLILN